MCGIIGYIGQENARDKVINGLYKLEYRGYDSSGIALRINKDINVYKDVGRVSNIDNITTGLKSNISIGHTRWATHGKVTIENSHPHSSNNSRFIVCHNGIIDNYLEIKKHYLSKYTFISETDTEVIANLIEHLSTNIKDMRHIIYILTTILQGSYALLILDKEDNDKIYAVKNRSPLLIGKNKIGNYVASDLIAMTDCCHNYYDLKDKEFAAISEDYIDIYDKYNYQIYPSYIPIKQSHYHTELNKYDHYMLKEIEEQPDVIKKIINKYIKNNVINIDSNIIDYISKSRRIHIIAAGTSYHAGLIGKYMFEKLSNIYCEVHIASEFVYNTPLLEDNASYIFVSQSGETADLRSCLKLLKNLSKKVLLITNVPTSTLARESDYYLEVHAGPEISVASTKAYTAQVCMLSLLAYKCSKCCFDIKKELIKVCCAISEVIESKTKIKELTKEYLTKRNAFFIGRGLDYSTSQECALKLKEISYIQAEGFAAGELKHGTISLIEQDTPVIAFIIDKNTAKHTRSSIEEVKSRGANTLIVSSRKCSAESDNIILSDVHPIYAPIVSVVVGQYLSYYAALHLDNDIDKPRNLAKSVTVE